jgi:hypothetical protein
VGNGFPALEAEGVPYVFTSFELLGTFDAIRDVDGAARPLPAGMQSRRRLELPAPNSEVRF